MTSNKKISVCITCYNIENYVERCLNSIISNTYTNLEIICVNDGSTDNTLNVLKKLEKTDSRIKVINKKNGGVQSARNRALQEVTGDYIAFIDGDDWIHYQYFEILMQAQEETRADVVICDYMTTSHLIEDIKINIEKVKKYKIEIEDLINNETMKTRIWGRIYSKNIIKNIKIPENLFIGEDKAYNLLVLCNNDNIVITLIREKLYYYYQRNDSIVHTIRHSNIIYATKYLIENLKQIPYKQGKKIIILQAMHDMLAYRYLEMYNEDKNAVKQLCQEIYKEIDNEWDKVDISLKEKIKYKLLYKIPLIYRIIRIVMDPTMLKWEKEERKRRREKK